MTAASNYLENELLDHALGTGSWTMPADVYVQLHTDDPGEACTSSVAGETSRVIATFAASSGGTASSNADIDWTSVSTSETYTHLSLWDNSTPGAGNALFYGAFSSSIAVTAGDNFTIASGGLDVTLA